MKHVHFIKDYLEKSYPAGSSVLEKEMRDYIGCTPATWSRYMSGKILPPIKLFQIVAQVCDCEMEDLLPAIDFNWE